MAMQEMITIRPAELEVAPTFQGSVHECPVNVYRMKIQAQSADSRRFSFAWRSPGNNLICSPQGFIEFDLNCHVPYNFTEAEALSAICGHVDRSADTAIANGAAERSGNLPNTRSFGARNIGSVEANYGNTRLLKAQQIPGSRGYRAGLAFGEGDAVGSCIESIQYTINGASISHQNWHLFKRSLDRCWVPSRVMQRVYAGAGGCWNAYDCTPLSGQSSRPDYFPLANDDASGLAAPGVDVAQAFSAPTVEGFTADSGLARRMKNLYSAIIGKTKDGYPGVKTGTTEDYNGSSFKLRIRFPLCGGLFNPCWGESGLSRSCPYQRLALAIPNYNQGSLTVLFKDLEKSIVRRLGRTLSTNKVRGRGTLINNSEALTKTVAQKTVGVTTNTAEAEVECVPFTIVYDSTKLPNLFLTYLRLQAFRRPPEVASFTTYRTQTYLGPQCTAANMGADKTKVAIGDVFDQGVGEVPYLICDGSNPFSKIDSGAYGYKYDQMTQTRRWKVSFQNLQFAQPPSYIFICAQKDSKVLAHRNPMSKGVKYDLTADDTNDWDDASNPLLFVDEIDSYTMKPGAAQLGQPAVDNPYSRANMQAQNFRTAEKLARIKAAGRYVAQNQDANLAIDRLSILVQSSVGSFQVTDDAYPFKRDQQIMWDEHRRNCNTDYFAKSGMSDWQKRGCCVLLSVSQYLHGLGSSAGVAFPIQISCDVEFVNKCQFIEGLYAYDEKGPRGPMVFSDYINARPVLVGIFDKQVLQIASSSAVLSAQNISQASFSQIVASRQ